MALVWAVGKEGPERRVWVRSFRLCVRSAWKGAAVVERGDSDARGAAAGIRASVDCFPLGSFLGSYLVGKKPKHLPLVGLLPPFIFKHYQVLILYVGYIPR